MCHCPDTPGAAQSCCALNRQDETGLASVQSVWGHLWKMEQSPAAAVPRVTTLSPILATSALLCPEHNPFMCTERHRKWGCDQRDSIHPTDGQDGKPAKHNTQEGALPPRALPPAAGWDLGCGWRREGLQDIPAACLPLPEQVKPSGCTQQPADDLSESPAKGPDGREANISL